MTGTELHTDRAAGKYKVKDIYLGPIRQYCKKRPVPIRPLVLIRSNDRLPAALVRGERQLLPHDLFPSSSSSLSSQLQLHVCAFEVLEEKEEENIEQIYSLQRSGFSLPLRSLPSLPISS